MDTENLKSRHLVGTFFVRAREPALSNFRCWGLHSIRDIFVSPIIDWLNVACRAERRPGARYSCRRRKRREHIVCRQWPSGSLQLELTDRLDLHGLLDLRQYSGADDDLSRLGLIAEARGNVGDGPNRGIIEAALEADGAERGKAVRYPNAEANLVPPPTPVCSSHNYGTVTRSESSCHKL